MSTPGLILRPITAENWLACALLKVAPDQQLLVASNAMSLAQAAYQPQCRPLGVYAGETMVGFVMYAKRAEDGRYWIERVMVGAGHQGRGHGRAAMRALLALLAEHAGCREVFISYVPANDVARRLYASLGFVETGETDEDGEVIARLSLGD